MTGQPLERTILQSLRGTPLHGYDIYRSIAQRLGDAHDGSQGSIYPELYRLESQGLVSARWACCATDRRTRYYALTPAGRTRLYQDPRAPWHGTAGAASALACGMAVSLGAAGDDMPRVRSTSPVIAGLIEEGAGRSRTFRHLVDTIAGTDGIVYVETGQCRHSVRSCLSLSVTRAGGFRILRILVDTGSIGRGTSTNDFISSLGHELRHAIEVLEVPSLDTTQKIYLFYVREAATRNDSFETIAAIGAGNQIRKELAR